MRGEYWIFPDGSYEYADGDVGNANHEVVVANHCIGILADEFGFSSEADIEDAMVEIADALDCDVEDIKDRIDDSLVPIFNAATMKGDLRKFAMDRWNWVAMRGNTIECKRIDAKTLKFVFEAVLDLLFELGEEGEEDFRIDEYSGGKSIVVSTSQMEAGSYDVSTSHPFGRNSSVDAMDRSIQNPFYNNRHESIEGVRWADTEDHAIISSAWELAETSDINVLSDKDLFAVLEMIPSVWEDGPTVIGVLFVSVRDGGSVFSFDIIVDPDYQGHGVGSKLFTAAIDEAKSSGCEKIELEIVNPLVASMAKKRGFRNVGGRMWEKDLLENHPLGL